MKAVPDYCTFPISPFPVDLLASQLVSLAFGNFCASKNVPTIFHFSPKENQPARQVFSWWNDCGCQLKFVTVEEWYALVKSKLSRDNPLISMVDAWKTEETEMVDLSNKLGWNEMTFSTLRTEQALADAGGEPFPDTSNISKFYSDHFHFIASCRK